jgi:3-hydroxyacyl-[acyl-carrier-protein] dehydratase
MRYFLLDQVTELVPGVSARGLKNVSLSDEVLHDHFPDHPVLPGALVIEAAAQLAGFLIELSADPGPLPPRRALLAQIRRAKFYQPAQPGDQIDLRARLTGVLDGAAEVDCEASVGGARSLEATLTFILKTVDSERVHEQRRRLYRVWTRALEPKPVIR